jgi:hypothetical protein
MAGKEMFELEEDKEKNSERRRSGLEEQII